MSPACARRAGKQTGPSHAFYRPALLSPPRSAFPEGAAHRNGPLAHVGLPDLQALVELESHWPTPSF